MELDFQFNAYVLFYLISMIVLVGVATLGWPHRRTSVGMAFIALELTSAWWALTAAMESGFLDPDVVMFWGGLGYLGLYGAPAYFLILALRYTSAESTLPERYDWYLVGFVLAVSLLALTNPLHGWIWTDLVDNPAGIGANYVYLRGPLWGVAAAVAYVEMIVGTFILLRAAITMRRLYRLQATWIMFGVPFPWVSSVLYLLGNSPFPGLDLTPLMLAFASMFFAAAMFRYRMFDLLPLAHVRIFDSLRSGLVVVDNSGRIVEINPAAIDFISHVLPDPPRRWEGVQANTLQEPFGSTFLGEINPINEIVLLEGDELRILEVRIFPVKTGREEQIGAIYEFNDITDRKQIEQDLAIKGYQLEQLAVTDGLTGLFNYRYADGRLQHEFTRAERYNNPISLAVIDIDRFKRVNDEYGHACGDEVLRSLANVLRNGIRNTDLCARLGGEEFLLIFPETQAAEAALVVDRLRIQTQKLNLLASSSGCNPENGAPVVTFSAGIANKHPGEAPADTLRRADQLLYQAKQAGRNRVMTEDIAETGEPPQSGAV